MKKKKVKKIRINLFNIILVISAIIASIVLIHDFIFWGIIPAFTGKFYQLTYFGLFIDLVAVGTLELFFQFIGD